MADGRNQSSRKLPACRVCTNAQPVSNAREVDAVRANRAKIYCMRFEMRACENPRNRFPDSTGLWVRGNHAVGVPGIGFSHGKCDFIIALVDRREARVMQDTLVCGTESSVHEGTE